MVRDICKAYPHFVIHRIAVDRSPGPNPLCGCYQELAFSGAKEEAKVIEKLGRFRAVDESSNEAEVLGSANHKAIVSYHSYRPCDFDSGVLTFFHSHDEAPIFWMFCCLCADYSRSYIWDKINVLNVLFGILAEKAVSRKAEKNDPSNRSFVAAGVRAKTGNPSLSKR